MNYAIYWDGIRYGKLSPRGKEVALWNFRAAREGIEWSALITAGVLPLLFAAKIYS